MRSKKAIANIMSSLLLQLTTIICGFIVPILIIKSYGSNVNGVINSITQFLGYIALLEAGIGGVVRAALYKPLANKDNVTISRIVKTAEKFFKIIAYILIGYLIVVAFVFPNIVSGEFDKIYTITLVLIIGMGTFAQYFFGISYQLLLQADQRLYFTSLLQVFTVVINTVIVVVLINKGASIHFVKLCSAAVLIARPLVLNIYVKYRYKIIKNVNADRNALNQKWDGLGHHISYFVNNNTDIAVLTLFTNMREVSVYSIYMMVVAGIRNITTTFSSGIEAAFGNMIANGERNSLYRNFISFEFLSFFITTVLFTSASLLILPFISIYTKGITDVNYIRPLFAYVLVAAGAAYCIRLPYHSIVIAAGHFKQTRNGAFVEAIINIVFSIVLVNSLGILGVAIGTLFAMLFRTFQYIFYISKNILERRILDPIKRILVSVSSVLVSVIIIRLIPTIAIDNYFYWGIYAIGVTTIIFLVTLFVNLICYFQDLKNVLQILNRVIKSKGKNYQS
ncbi:lipopolysaccharide biosynthesis protein [Heyndrickxia sp. NPDC080065]|uniref:lipopolysaccharide biosynthesis protein n=1 Tax=Heyndrickxia sp. NPDC080065 TaxID=3390568 RepID=UPI003D09435A